MRTRCCAINVLFDGAGDDTSANLVVYACARGEKTQWLPCIIPLGLSGHFGRRAGDVAADSPPRLLKLATLHLARDNAWTTDECRCATEAHLCSFVVSMYLFP